MKNLKYGIAIFPSKEIQDVANSYRKRYDPNYKNIPPHITLKERFKVNTDEIDQLAKELNKIAADMEPFEIEIHKVSSFSPVTNTVYLKVAPNESLTYLNEKMHQGIFPSEQQYAFVPHITISQDLSEDEHSDVYGSMKMLTFDLKDTVDRFQLLYQLEDGTWTVYETFKFGQ
ncbi:YjcG family protein [Tenuibacillus multivorans]|uniref:Putative phosphoesterase SAMN05216498_3179 n=1 Tax=Tenuibacillus multivorans TaxID=237069 RepID=A0A1H0EJE8_9BACI|nr:YjcG family protein [Tenuibacillus multivorans]GEL77131.1 putative phosphoesterase YjcG [Tenuibacillus multivorans]SDN82538.1 2'-5' RNA ligase [Tenuibacillus multivorans]